MLHRQLRARPGVCQGPASAVLWPLHPTAAARPSISPEPLPHRPCIRTQVADAAQPTSADVKPRRRRKQSAPASVSASAPPEPSTAEVADGVLLYGFPPHELAAIHEQRDTVFPGLDAARVGVVSAAAAARQTAGSLAQQAPTTLEQAVADYAAQEATKCHEDSAQGPGHAQGCNGRVVFLLGGAGPAFAPSVNDVLVSVDVAPAVVGVLQPKHLSSTFQSVCDSLRRSYAELYELVRPVQTTTHLTSVTQHIAAANGSRSSPTPSSADAKRTSSTKHSNIANNNGTSDSTESSTGGSTRGSTDVSTQGSTQGSTAHSTDSVLEPLRSAVVVLSATLDGGRVPTSTGGEREDISHMVVLDGLLTPSERTSLLDWLTAPGHDHSGPPPEDKWERACADTEGDAASWGLRPHVLQALESDPPPPVLALQSRLSALYPEYVIAHMPADALATEEGNITAFVGNAVMQGDPCAWHVDCDPSLLPPNSPFVNCYGYYCNREPGKPLFVSLLLYLNEEWPLESHAETLFLDRNTDAGIFVRPAPGRVVLMDQDMPHRISAPSRAANGAPRYSLVWKMVWFERTDATLSDTLRNAEATRAGSKAGASKGRRKRAAAANAPGLCRPEWGRAVALSQGLGQPAWSP